MKLFKTPRSFKSSISYYRAGDPFLVAFWCLLLGANIIQSLSAQHLHDEEAEHDHDHGHAAEQMTHNDVHKDHEVEAKEEEHMHLHEEEEQLVHLEKDVLDEFGIKLGNVQNGVLHEIVTLPGELHFNGEAVAHVTPRFAGTVLSIEARLSDKVEQGQTLARMESSETLRPFELKAPFSGVVVDYDLTLGETVEAGRTLFTVADLSTVWADFQIYQKDMAQVHRGLEVEVAGSQDLPPQSGVIAYIAPTIDEHTRTGLARVFLGNKNQQWKPGQFVTGKVTVEEHPVDMILPRSAILSLNGKTIVFVEEEPDRFEPREIQLGHKDETHFEVLSGLEVGETVVIENAISLKAELGKASFGGHEGHVH